MAKKEDARANRHEFVDIIDYTPQKMHESPAPSVSGLSRYQRSTSTTWINIKTIRDRSLIEQVGTQLNLHPLTVSDVMTEQRPKIEYFDNYIFMILKMLDYDKGINDVTIEQVSIVIMPSVIVSFQQREGDVFDMIREGIRSSKGKLRKTGSDYLAYLMVDALVDNYFTVLEQIDDELDSVEEKLLDNPTRHMLHKLHRLKQKLLTVRRSVWPVRDAIHTLERSGGKIIKTPTQPYLRDLHDKTVRVIENVETQNDMIASMLDVYFSNLSHKMNEVMKVLTIIATIFIPLTFITGVYGMNFDYMPELDWRFGYFSILVLMVLLASAMFYFFKRKNWI